MAQEALRNDQLGLGRAILLATDAAGMDCEGAFWIQDTEDHTWRYFLVTSFIEHMGPRKIYLLLNRVLERKISETEMQNFEIFLCRPKDRLVKELRKQVRTDVAATEPRQVSVKWNGHSQNGVVYRMRATPLDEVEIRNAQRRFRRISGKLVA
jgi:hypothetical protein